MTITDSLNSELRMPNPLCKMCVAPGTLELEADTITLFAQRYPWIGMALLKELTELIEIGCTEGHAILHHNQRYAKLDPASDQNNISQTAIQATIFNLPCRNILNMLASGTKDQNTY